VRRIEHFEHDRSHRHNRAADNTYDAARCCADPGRLRQHQHDDARRRSFRRSLNGHLAAVLAVAHKPKGAVYPVGTVLQLIPTEAMVKRHKGYSPATGDWSSSR